MDDGSGAPNSSTEENLHITITGTNEAPVIKGGELTLEATEDTAITVGDKLDVSDDRVNEGNLSYSVAAGGGAASSNAGNMAAGQYGTLFINADGTYSYQLNNQMQAVQELGEDSEPLKETFTIFVKDQDGAEVAKNVTVTINGTNDAPVLSLDTPVLTIKEGSTAEVGGTASATDVDKGDTLSYALKDGTLSEETGEYVCKTDYGQEEAIAVFGHDPRIYQTTVKRFLKDEKNHVRAVETIKLQSVHDPKTGRMRMEEIAGSEQVLDADLVLIAAGFLGAQSYVTEAFGVDVTPRTNVATEAGHYRTNADHVFTAGDMHRGQSLVVWAIREGREAAREVDEYLMGYTNLT